MSTARLQRRIAGLEALAPAHQSPMCILIVGMAPPGREWMPEEFSLPDGSRLRRDVGEDQSAFGARVRSAAVAMLTGGARVAIAVAVEGSESRADAESNR